MEFGDIVCCQVELASTKQMIVIGEMAYSKNGDVLLLADFEAFGMPCNKRWCLETGRRDVPVAMNLRRRYEEMYPVGKLKLLATHTLQGWEGKATKSMRKLTEKEKEEFERKQEEEKFREVIKIYFDKIKDDICPHCQVKIERKQQVGRCVYADPCGHRLYQGKLKP